MLIKNSLLIGALALSLGCSSSDDDAQKGSGGSTATGGSDASGGSGGTGGVDAEPMGGDDAGTGGSETNTGGTDASTGGAGTGGVIDAPDEPKRCIGETEASVEAACNVHQAGTMACTPMDGCGNEGGCRARVSQNACVSRGIGACGTADGGATCIVRLNDPEDPFQGGTCVQSSHGALCHSQMNQSDCLAFDDDTGAENLCQWDQPAEPKCVALTCAQAFPFEQACTSIPGCEWK